MTFFIVFMSIALLIFLISYFKVDAFIAFLIVSIGAAVALGLPVAKIAGAVDKGIGSIMGGLTLIIVLGAMLGKLIAESGAAERIASSMTGLVGESRIRWGLMVTGLIVGIPLFYGVGFVLLVPLIFTIAYKYKMPPVYLGLPMLAALSVTHGFTPPHPAPVALAQMLGADLGVTLIYGLIIAVPTIIIGGPIFGMTLKNMRSGESTMFKQSEASEKSGKYGTPGTALSITAALLPVAMLVAETSIPYSFPNASQPFLDLVKFLGAPSIVMLISLIFATYALGIKQNRSIKEVMDICAAAIKDIAGILLIIAGSGVFKEIMEQSGVSRLLAESLKDIALNPIVLAWLITAIIRVMLGSATVAGLTAAGVLGPMILASGINPAIMVLSIGAGSLFFSHVNDSGFWMFKEYFGISIKETFLSWTLMETIVSVVGLICVLLLNSVIS